MKPKTTTLQPATLKIIRDKATEHPFTGEYNQYDQTGTYLCRQCGSALFRSQTKFQSACGWPSFDQEVAGAVNQLQDADGQRVEIVCTQCNAHLGHVFQGEGFTSKNTRHCVNSLSLDFVSDPTILHTEEAIYAAGCFWGVEYYFKKLPGVLKTEVGYTGGHTYYPSYKDICNGNTGHYEAIRVLYDPKKITYEQLTQYFFEIHDPSQRNGQGPDLGHQYLSVIFYQDHTQKEIAYKLIQYLENTGTSIATQALPASVFWTAEKEHQDYYTKVSKEPYCHHYTKKF